ncbi:MAG: thioesterase family protein [Deinococcales bacterium]
MSQESTLTATETITETTIEQTRLKISQLSHHTDIQVRFCDTDAVGHLNNLSYGAYAETARLNFFKDLGTEVKNLILARLAINFRVQTNFEQKVWVKTWVTKLGGSSIGVHHDIFADGVVVADVESVVVHFDYVANRSSPMPQSLRGALEPYLNPS